MDASEHKKGGKETKDRSLRTLIASVVAVVVVFWLVGIAVAADPTAEASRTIDPRIVERGDEIEITVEFTSLLAETKAFALLEDYPDGWTFTRGTDDAITFRPGPPPEWVWFFVSPGATKTVTYTLTVPLDAAAGDYIVEGTVTSAEVSNPVGGDATVTVRVLHDLTTSSTAGGSVTDPGEGTFTYDEGTVVDLVATPDAGYRFDEWTGDVGTVADVHASTTTITMNGDYSVIAEFVRQYDLTTNSTEGGSVTEPGEATFTYDQGTVVDLLAVADACYEFINWTGDVDTIADADAASTNIIMNGDYSITANFALIDCDYLDYYGDWEHYCVGNEVWMHRLLHDFSCVDGECVESTYYADEMFVDDCDDLDGWVEDGDPYTACDGDNVCTYQDMVYLDYSCVGGECVPTETDWRTDLIGCESCDDGDPCTINTCGNGICVHTPVYADILEYYRGLYGNPDEVSTLELLAAADDWISDVVPLCFGEPITTFQLLELADEWIAGGP